MVCKTGGKLAHRRYSEGGNQWLLLRPAGCHKWASPVTNTGPHTVQQLHKYLGDGIESALAEFVDYTELGGEVDTSGGRCTLQRDLNGLEE